MFGWLKRLTGRSIRAASVPKFDTSLFDRPNTELFTSLAQHWAKDDPGAYAPSRSQLGVEQLEQRYEVRLPRDFRDYLLHAAPKDFNYWDHIGAQWWPVGDIKNIPDECGDKPLGRSNPEIAKEVEQYLIFGDFLIWCYAWAICCSDGANRGRIALIGGMPDGFVVDSFREFLALELADSHQIHQPK